MSAIPLLDDWGCPSCGAPATQTAPDSYAIGHTTACRAYRWLWDAENDLYEAITRAGGFVPDYGAVTAHTLSDVTA